MAARRAGSGPIVDGSNPTWRAASATDDAVAVVQSAHLIGVDGTRHQPRTHAGQAEPAALLLRETGDRQRPSRRDPSYPQLVDGQQAGHHAERTVEGAAAGDRIQVRAGDDGTRAG